MLARVLPLVQRGHRQRSPSRIAQRRTNPGVRGLPGNQLPGIGSQLKEAVWGLCAFLREFEQDERAGYVPGTRPRPNCTSQPERIHVELKNYE